MFYYIVSKIPIISSNDESRFFKIFIVGTILYIILHAYLFSCSNKNSELISRYAGYMYYVWGADFAITGITNQMSTHKSSEEDSEDEQQVINQSETMSREEIEKRLASINVTPTLDQDKFPFVRREAKPDNQPSGDEKQSPSADTNIQLYKKSNPNITETEIEFYKKK
jgi:hypothetical protein